MKVKLTLEPSSNLRKLNKMEFDNISDAYAVVECYEYGSVSQRIYLEASRYALEYFRKKYGKDSFWFRELFAHMQSNEWENTFKVRCLLHAEVLGCPHKDCEKATYFMKCQHCRYIEGIKEEWQEKVKDNV